MFYLNLFFCGAEIVLAGDRIRFQDDRVCQLGEDASPRRLELKLPCLDELQGGNLEMSLIVRWEGG